jgi:hypothetical protein
MEAPEKHEVLDVLKEFLDSKEFEYKFKIWTAKTCKEVMASHWKPVAIVSSAFMVILAFLLTFIFNHINTTIDKLQSTTSSLSQSVVRLETTVELMYDRNHQKTKPSEYDYQK